MRVTAEGVENGVQARSMRTLGCDAAQGWHWAPAMEPAALLTWAGDRTSRPGPVRAALQS
jgi:sensor c-di-GMP phosphodiesterase-like protein